MRRIPLLFLFLALALAAAPAYASPSVAQPAYAGTSLGYTVGYTVIVEYGGQNLTVANTSAGLGAGPRVGAVETVDAVGVARGADNYTYSDVGNASAGQVVIPPPETVTQTVTHEYTTTVTVTKTITGPNGETTVVTEVRTVTLPHQQAQPRRALLLGAGALALLFLLLLAKR